MTPLASLPAELTARPPVRGDLDALVEMIQRCDVAAMGEPDTDADDVKMAWDQPGFDMERDALLIAGPDGAPRAYAIAMDGGTGTISGGVDVDPPARGHGLGTALLSWMVSRGRALAAERGLGPTTLETEASADNPAAAHLLLRAGFRPTRATLQMEMDLTGGVPEPEWPPGVELRGFRPGTDELVFYELVKDTFADVEGWSPRPFENWRTFTVDRSAFDPELALMAVATAGGDRPAGEVAGGVMNFVFDDVGFVQYLAVSRAWRQHGLGLALLRAALGRLAARGLGRALLHVDSENTTGATRLYERAGMHQSHRWDRWELPLS
jgi:mycothiol synthase